MISVLVTYGTASDFADKFFPPARRIVAEGREYRIYTTSAPADAAYFDVDGTPLCVAHTFETLDEARKWIRNDSRRPAGRAS